MQKVKAEFLQKHCMTLPMMNRISETADAFYAKSKPASGGGLSATCIVLKNLRKFTYILVKINCSQ